MKKKNTHFLFGVIALAVLCLIIYGGVIQQTALTQDTASLYTAFSSDVDSFTYGSIEMSDQRNSLFDLQGLEESVRSNFMCATSQCTPSNKGFFKFYLEQHDIPSDTFSAWGHNLLSVFQPNNVVFPTRWDESDGASKNWCTVPLGDYITEIEALGFVWDVNCGWSGGWDDGKMAAIATNLRCIASGQTTAICQDNYIEISNPFRCAPYDVGYHMIGDVTFEADNAFICHVNSSEIYSVAPSTFDNPDGESKNVGGIGITGTIVFEERPPCIPDWECGDWSECVDFSQDRTCPDINDCGSDETHNFNLTQWCNSTVINTNGTTTNITLTPIWTFEDNVCEFSEVNDTTNLANNTYTDEGECTDLIIPDSSGQTIVCEDGSVVAVTDDCPTIEDDLTIVFVLVGIIVLISGILIYFIVRKK